VGVEPRQKDGDVAENLYACGGRLHRAGAGQSCAKQHSLSALIH